MNKWTIGISTGCFYKSDIRNYLDTIKRSGFKIIEVSSSQGHLDIHNLPEVAEIGESIKKLGMSVYSVHAPFSKEIDTTSPDSVIRKYSQNEVLQSAISAQILNAECLVLHPWPEKVIEAHSPEHLLRKTLAAEFIKNLSQKCEELGIKLALENMQPHLLISPLKDLLWIKSETKIHNVYACIDTGHAFIAKDLQEAILELSGHIACVHIHDNFGKNDDHLLPGEGVINWNQVYKNLREVRYHGVMIIELLDTTDKNDPEIILSKAKNAADAMFENY